MYQRLLWVNTSHLMFSLTLTSLILFVATNASFLAITKLNATNHQSAETVG